MVEQRVYDAMAKPVVGHLDPYFFQVVEESRRLLRAVFGTKNEFTLALSGTGSAGMEAAVANFVDAGSKFAVLANGYFCDRISEMGRRYGAQVVRLEKAWGESFSDQEAREFILRERPQTVAFVQAETSTGVFQAGKGIAAAAHEVGALVIADCVTSLGGVPVMADENGFDIAYSCSQKALGCPPGLAPVTISPRALERLRGRTGAPRVWYLDLKLLDEYFGSAHRYHHTAPISMFYALREALALIAEEGVENRWARHCRNHLAFVAGVEAMGLKMLVPEGRRLWTLNTVCAPDGVEELKVRKRLLADYDIEVLGGFGPLLGKIFRVGLMGPLANPEPVLSLLDAFESCLKAEGYRPAASGREAAAALYATLAKA